MHTSTPRLGGRSAGRRLVRALPVTAGLCLLVGCSTVQNVKTLVTGPSSPYLTGYIGEVVADEPRAALVGRDVLARGGSAADAAAAVGLGLSVTLPSRASLGAGGACLAFDAASPSAAEAILFMPVAGPGGVAADRPASVPMLARGLFLLQARHGSVDFDELIRPAAELARNGITVSRALADDLAAVRTPLLANPQARATFGSGTGDATLVSGDRLEQPQLAATLQHLAVVGVGDLYTGALGGQFVAGANAAGGGLDDSFMRSALPIARKPLLLEDRGTRIAFLPPPADGGLATAAAFQALLEHDSDALQISEAVASAWRTAHPAQTNNSDLTETAQATLAARPATAASGEASELARLPASTSFVVLDRSGNAVSCAISMDNLFGTGRMAGDTGIVIGASPARVQAPLLAAAIAWSKAEHHFLAAVAGSGQSQAPAAVAYGLHEALRNARPLLSGATSTGRANAISCPGGLPGDAAGCIGETDPRGLGLAIGSN